MTEASFQAVILAAGKGTRMKSDGAKVLFELMGKPLIGHVAQAALDAGADQVVAILGHRREEVEAYLVENFGERVKTCVQDQQLGTGHAVWCAKDHLDDAPDYTLILSGDVPMLRGATLQAFVADTLAAQVDLGMMTAVTEDAGSYGRVTRRDDHVTGVVEFRDATEDEQAIREFNAGVYLARTTYLREALAAIMAQQPDNAQGEYYLTDLVAHAAAAGGVLGWIVDEDEIHGINTRLDLARRQKALQQRINENWALAGVTFLDLDSVYIEASVALAPDVTLEPNVMLFGASRIGKGVVIEQGSTLRDASVDEEAHIKAHSYITQARIGKNAQIGPFAHLRPLAEIGERAKVGNFVEIKKARLQTGAKASHLTYIGDAEVGAGANIGAGTITCNYDGAGKHRTVIGDGAFIGSGVELVAPVSIGAGATIGAGSTVSRDAPAGELTVSRSRQTTVKGWRRPVKKPR